MATLEIKAVEMTRSIRDTQHEQLKGKTWDERVAFFKEQAQTLHQELDVLRHVLPDGAGNGA